MLIHAMLAYGTANTCFNVTCHMVLKISVNKTRARTMTINKITKPCMTWQLDINTWMWQLSTEQRTSANWLEMIWMRFGCKTYMHSMSTTSSKNCSTVNGSENTKSSENQAAHSRLLSTWQFNLYTKSDSSPSEIQRVRLSRLQSLWFDK